MPEEKIKTSTRGGVRVPGKGKKLGRPPKPKKEIKTSVSIAMLPDSWKAADAVVAHMQKTDDTVNRSTLMEHLVLKAKEELDITAAPKKTAARKRRIRKTASV